MSDSITKHGLGNQVQFLMVQKVLYTFRRVDVM